MTPANHPTLGAGILDRDALAFRFDSGVELPLASLGRHTSWGGGRGSYQDGVLADGTTVRFDTSRRSARKINRAA